MIIMIFLLSLLFVLTTVAPDRSDKMSEIPDSFFKFNPTLVIRSLFSLSLSLSPDIFAFFLFFFQNEIERQK